MKLLSLSTLKKIKLNVLVYRVNYSYQMDFLLTINIAWCQDSAENISWIPASVSSLYLDYWSQLFYEFWVFQVAWNQKWMFLMLNAIKDKLSGIFIKCPLINTTPFTKVCCMTTECSDAINCSLIFPKALAKRLN